MHMQTRSNFKEVKKNPTYCSIYVFENIVVISHQYHIIFFRGCVKFELIILGDNTNAPADEEQLQRGKQYTVFNLI